MKRRGGVMIRTNLIYDRHFNGEPKERAGLWNGDAWSAPILELDAELGVEWIWDWRGVQDGGVVGGSACVVGSGGGRSGGEGCLPRRVVNGDFSGNKGLEDGQDNAKADQEIKRMG